MADHSVGILIFDDVEVLDFCGPFEVFSVAGRRQSRDCFKVFTVAGHSPVSARNEFSINPTYLFKDCPPIDILVVPGGFGTRVEIDNPTLIGWIVQRAKRAELVVSVCTGSLLLAKANLLQGLSATTHHGALDELRQLAPDTIVRADQRIVDNGSIITSGGISAGIDMSLHVLKRLYGGDVAAETAAYMEYKSGFV